MEPITSDTILILAGSFLCVFLSLVTVGGTFLYWRVKQQQNSDKPPPQPPPVTRDVHAEPLAEMPTRNDAEPGPPAVPHGSNREPTPHVSTREPEPRPSAFEPSPPRVGADETVTRTRPVLRPLGMDLDEEFDEGGETTTRNLPIGRGFEPLVLPTPNENDTTPTVIIDRNQPMTDEDDEV